MRTILLVAASAGCILVAIGLRDHYLGRNDRRMTGDLFSSFAGFSILNFFLFLGLAVFLGGDALNGKREDGEYFLGEHGQYTQVGFGVYLYSFIHAWVTMVTFSAMLVGHVFRVHTGRSRFHEKDDFHPRGRGTV